MGSGGLCDGGWACRRVLQAVLLATLLAALLSLAGGPALGNASAATVEGTWEFPEDSVNDPAGCEIYTALECTKLYAGGDTLEIIDKAGVLSGTMKSGHELLGPVGGTESEGKLRFGVEGEGSRRFEGWEFNGTLSPDGKTMGGACNEFESRYPCFEWSGGVEEHHHFAWDAVRVGSLAPSTTTVQCPSTGTGKFQCSVVVSGEAEGKIPTGTVSFAAPEGSFVPLSCTLEIVIGGAGCSVQFTRPTSAKGSIKVMASYGGDKAFAASSGEFTIVTSIAISGANVLEPASGSATANFAVTLSSASASAVSVEYETADGTGPGGALAPGMYEAGKGTLTFEPGETAQTIPVKVLAAGFTGARTFTVKLSNPAGATLENDTGTGTIVGPSPLQVSISVSPSKLEVEQNESGAVPLQPTATVTVKDISKVPIEDVTLPASLKIGWHGPAPINALPVKQIAGPEPAQLALGTLAPGASTAREYKLQVEGDGQFDIESLVTGSEEGATVKALGTTTIEPTSQLLVMKNTLGAEVHSQTHPSLIKSGTHFLIKVQLSNRSYVHRLQIDPYYAGLEGNALGGGLVSENEPTTFNVATGSMAEVTPSPAIVLEPRETKTYFAVVGTTASDAFTKNASGGGTHAVITFKDPEVSTLDAEDNPTPAAEDDIVLTPGSEQFQVGIDDSDPPPPPSDAWEATWAVTKGVVYGLWGLTYGTVRGVVDLGVLYYKGVYSLTTATIDEMYHLTELWAATEADPEARQDLIDSIEQKVETEFADAPWLLAEKGAALYDTINHAVGAYFTKIGTAWYAGDWREALTDMAETGTTVIGSVAGPAALKLAAGALVRIAPVAEAWSASLAARYAKTAKALEAVSETIEPAETAIRGLAEAADGYEPTVNQLRKFIGMDAKEASWLGKFTKERKLSVVLRSRAEESLEWIKKGAMLKPSWIKSKNVTWLDVEFFGYSPKDVGRVVMRKLPGKAAIEAELEVRGVREGSAEYKAAIERWTERDSTYTKEIHQMEEWNRQKNIKGKWPWKESGVDPKLQADQIKDYKFRLGADEHDPHSLVPEVYDPDTAKWGSITGDIDLVAVTKADGTSLSAEEYVKVLKELAHSPLQIQHPDSTVWVYDNKFWFSKKQDYLNAKGNVQFGADGKARLVSFNEAASDPSTWTPFNYRIFWNDGLSVGPGQVP